MDKNINYKCNSNNNIINCTIIETQICPFPLIYSDTTIKYCLNKCCIPCPIQNYLYDDKLEYGLFISDILRIISFILSLIIFICYIYLFKKKHFIYNSIILNLSLCILLFSSVIFFTIKNPIKIQCTNNVTPSNQNNNILCFIQGSILVFSTFSTILWISILIINFHIKTFWNKYRSYFNNKNLNFEITNYKVTYFIGWIIPLIFTLICIFLKSISYEYSNLCLISLEWIFKLFFYPLGSIIFPCFLLHIFSLSYISYNSIIQVFTNIENKNMEVFKDYYQMITVFKNYWRYFLIGIISVSTLTFYWIFYFTQITKINNTLENIEDLKIWLNCISTNNNKNKCFYIIKDKIPSLDIMIFAEISVSIIGIWLFLLFGTELYKLKKKIINNNMNFLNL